MCQPTFCMSVGSLILKKEFDMGRVKEFAFWLAECVYDRQMSNQEIICTVNSPWSETYQEEYDKWLSEQIQAVRNNPQIYGPSDQS